MLLCLAFAVSSPCQGYINSFILEALFFFPITVGSINNGPAMVVVGRYDRQRGMCPTATAVHVECRGL
jgi:hypothetical protein